MIGGKNVELDPDYVCMHDSSIQEKYNNVSVSDN